MIDLRYMQILEMIHVRKDYFRWKISQQSNATTVFSMCNFPNMQQIFCSVISNTTLTSLQRQNSEPNKLLMITTTSRSSQFISTNPAVCSVILMPIQTMQLLKRTMNILTILVHK